AGLDTPTSGRVHIGDTDLTALSADAVTRFRRRHIGFVFQAYNLVGHLTVAENVQLPLLLDGRRPDPRWQDTLLESVGLAGMADRLPRELSGGQAQRVAIARALVTRPTVVFADEPTGALDRRTGDQVLDVLRGTAKQLGQTLVVVTHDPSVAVAAAAVLFPARGLLAGGLVAPTTDQVVGRPVQLGVCSTSGPSAAPTSAPTRRASPEASSSSWPPPRSSPRTVCSWRAVCAPTPRCSPRSPARSPARPSSSSRSSSPPRSPRRCAAAPSSTHSC